MADAVSPLHLVPPPDESRAGDSTPAVEGIGETPLQTPPVAPAVEAPPALDLGPEEFSPTMPVAALAFANLRRHARAFLRHEAGTREGVDPEALHDMRVAGRRMRAALGLFAPYLPKRAEALRRELGRLGRVLGAVRDLDVQLGQLAAWRRAANASESPSFDAIEAVLVRKRQVARYRLLEALDGKRYTRLTDRLCTFLRRGPLRRPATGRSSARLVAPELIGRRYRKTRRAGDELTRESSPTEFHALRIRAKGLRYALEFHQPLYDGEVAAMIECLTGLQDLLGEHQDAVVAAGHLETLAGRGRRHLPPRALFLMGTIAARYEERAKALRREFSKAYHRIGGRRWRALKSSLAEGKPPYAGGPVR